MTNLHLFRQMPDAGAEALALLDSTRGPVESPIRAEIFGAARFQQHGQSLAQAHMAQVRAHAAPFFPRLRENIRVLRESHNFISLQESSGHHISPAGEWLLDNFYVVMAQMKEIQEGLPRRYFRDLPVLMEAHLAGLPRIYGVAWAFVAHTDSAFDESLLLEFLGAYQQTRELTQGELWALPTTLRVVLIENLRRLAERVATAKAAREIANLWCDALESSAGSDFPDVKVLMEAMRQRGVGGVFALQVVQRLRMDPTVPSHQGARISIEVMDLIRKALASELPDPVRAQVQQHAEQAAENLSVRNAITSLRLLADADWRGLVRHTSVLMQAMETSATFRQEREDTQDNSLHEIERLARRSGQSESAVAQSLLALMHAAQAQATHADASGPPVDAPAYWLHGPGTNELRKRLGLKSGGLLPSLALQQKWTLLAYLTAILGLSVGLTAWFLEGTHPGIYGDGAWIWLALLAIWPASEAVIAVVHRLVSESLPPRRMPRLALIDGIPPAHRVLVVIPAMLTSTASVHALVRQLELHYLANSERCAQFALLSDYVDADVASLPKDGPLLQQAVAALDTLEARYADAPLQGAVRRFLLLHRERRWAETEQCWIGWERKRGKLEQLVNVLSGRGDRPFLDLGERSRPVPGTPYVVTLDSDTGLPPGSLRALVGVAAHPMNRPRVDGALRRVVSGYGILQPRITTPLPSPATATPFHWLFAGQCGVDPYSAAISEIYQDLFAEGTFCGKGLLHVGAMHAVLSGRLPQGQILSHDLIEGSIARCGGVSDITLMEDAPVHADVAASRVHRWTRGDWQLLPLLLQWRSFPLRVVNRWKMLDNLRRSLVAPASVALVLACMAGGTISPWAALSLVLFAFGAGPLLGAVAGLAPGRDDIAFQYFYRQALADIARAISSALWSLVMLLQQSMMLTHAIASALWRTLIRRRRLLQWTTSASAQAATSRTLLGLAWRHTPVTLASVAVWAVLWRWGNFGRPVLTSVICAVWAATPLWVWLGSRAWRTGQGASPSTADREYLLNVASDTWRFFERHVGSQSNHLPPDNVQTVPNTMVAQRTSPTNMGLYLLSVACAQRFGWISAQELLERCEKTLATLATLPRHQGHFLNWYDTQTLEPLHPAYVSTVDSGNLCGNLIAVAGACEALALQGGEGQAERLRLLAARCHALAMEPEFGFLYDARRRLLHIGYRVTDQGLDKSFYDLLASEARLASLWAIAKGDVPVEHWASLGRPFYAVGLRAGLRSWSGSMFEYLMPSLVIDEPVGSVLESAAHAAIREQMDFAREHGVPWGISESAYAASDHTLAYQYAPQGVPRLALRRTPPDELVVAPYATALAAMFAPTAAASNLRWLGGLNTRSEMGFIEALDFTQDRQMDGSAFTRVHTFMAHHQGMTLVALANVLLADAPRRWTMSNARLSAVASLLQERSPREVARLKTPEPMRHRPGRVDTARPATRDVVPGDGALQPTLLLSNGRYSVSVRANGAGWSRFGTADVSRWRDDALRDAYGTFIYLRRDSPYGVGLPVSLTQHPAPDPGAAYQSTFHSDHACLHAQWSDLRSCCTVWVSPEDDIELRRVEFWNPTSRPITLEVLSMFEVSLLEASADAAHPAFANLFVHADWDGTDQALYFARRPHVDRQEALHAAHFIAHADHPLEQLRAQTDRSIWLGRNRDAAAPLAHYHTPSAVSGQRSTGLDPIASLSMRITVPANSSVQVTFATAAAASRAALETLVDRYRLPSAIERSVLMSATFASSRLRDMVSVSGDRIAIQTLSTVLALLHARPNLRADAFDNDGECDRRALWRFGVSGDRPLIVVEISGMHGLRLVRSLVQALRLWSWGGLVCDLVILNAEPWSYLMPLQLELQMLRERHVAEEVATAPTRVCGLHVLLMNEVTPQEQSALRILARTWMSADGRPLSYHVGELVEWHDACLDVRIGLAGTALPDLPFAVPGAPPAGQFDSERGSFSFNVSQAHRPVKPWINVLANPTFGAHISEAGAGFSWSGNSRLQQLTYWSNDPVSDPGGESFYIQDLRTREVWNLGAGAGSGLETYTVEHGQGITSLSHRHGDIEVVATWCVDATLPLKHVRIALRNHGTRAAQLRVIGILEWIMGAQRADRQTVRTAWETLDGTSPASGHIDLLLATQCDAQAGFGGSTAFLALRSNTASHAAMKDWTCDRRELFDSRGWRFVPDHFGARAGMGLDPCAAASVTVVVAPGMSDGCVFVLGHGSTRDAALALARTCVRSDARQREVAVVTQWDDLLGGQIVRTPDPLFNVLVNRWLLYQTVVCRMWARAGFYQAGGAFGFRDQLQDAMALAVTAPDMLKQQLLLAASRQFVEGDVQHWWHAPTGAGVRTHCSDDLLWLPHATARYVAISGDTAVLDERIPFLEGASVPPGAQDAYYIPVVGAHLETLYEHCARAIDRSLPVGAHGLPLMGSGDWNDGMNHVGDQGRGESVWLGWFLCRVVEEFVPIAQARGDAGRVQNWQTSAQGWRAALQGPAWDGQWFKRAYFDDGTALGTHTAQECRIDLIAQAWSVLSGAALPQQQCSAMASAARCLVDETWGLNHLLHPPLQEAVPSAGYIQAYPPGVRENGGQYSHAGVWKLMAQAQLGDGDGAFRTFTQLSPAHRSTHPLQGPVYGIEPYVMAADVYTEEPYVGRGGWSWYTGSAAWMHRAAIESICGLQVREDRIRMVPCLPSHWQSIALTLRRHGREHEITVCSEGATADIEQTLARGALLLDEGAWLVLPEAGTSSHHLVIAFRKSRSQTPPVEGAPLP